MKIQSDFRKHLSTKLSLFIEFKSDKKFAIPFLVSKIYEKHKKAKVKFEKSTIQLVLKVVKLLKKITF